jgi:hypothetical protein
LATSDRRAIATISLAGLLGSFAAFVGCTVESHTFVDDSVFYATGGGNVGGTGATGGGTGGTGGGPGGSGGTGSGTGNENCTNGADDDGDTSIDCADPDCTTLFACVPGTPAGWTGPVALFEGAEDAPQCGESGGFPVQKQAAHSGLVEGTSTCPTCTCNASASSCTANLVFFESATCSAGGCWGNGVGCPGSALEAENGICEPLGFCQSNGGNTKASGVIATAITAKGGCTSGSTGAADIPTPTWNNNVRACGDAPTGQGCGGGNVCAPKPAAPFGTSACIYKTGDTACPSPYSTKKLVHQNVQDTRSCTPCGCGPLTGATCSAGTLTIYTGDFCSQNPQPLAVSSCETMTVDPTPSAPQAQCGNLPADTRSAMLTGSTLTGTPDCAETGGVISGAATAIDPITFCCL